MSFPNWGDVPTWVTAVAASAALVGVWLAYRAQAASLNTQRQQLTDQRDANRKQAEALDLQAKEIRQSLDRLRQEREERRRAQAKQVLVKVTRDDTMDFDRPGHPVIRKMEAVVTNTSRMPVYDGYVVWQKGTERLDDPDLFETLQPGETVTSRRKVDLFGEEMTHSKLIEAAVAFSDAEGVRWRAESNGVLEGYGDPRSWA